MRRSKCESALHFYASQNYVPDCTRRGAFEGQINADFVRLTPRQ
jgi:hypothetical protein